MASFNFTENRIEALQPPDKGEETHADTAVPGLRLRVLASGVKSYVVRYRLGGRGSPQRRLTLGMADAMRLDAARKAALKALAEVRNGGDPVGERNRMINERAQAAARTTIAELVDLHEAEQRAREVSSARDAARDAEARSCVCAGLQPRPRHHHSIGACASLDRVRDGVPGHAAPRPGSVATFRARLHGLFETALARGVVQANPLAGYRQPRLSKMQRIEREQRRGGRMLSMQEIANLWTACCDARVSQSFGAYVRMLMITGCRRSELAAARLSWIKPARADQPALLVIPSVMTKNANQHVVPLPSLAAAVIAGVPRLADTDLIFPGGRSRKTGKTAAISGWSKLWPALLAVAREQGLKGRLTIHDLRKSARSHWGRLGVSDRVAESLLNHTVPNVLIQIYDQRDFLGEKIVAMDMWCQEIEAALGADHRPFDVVTLRKPSAKRSRRQMLTA